MGNGINLSLTRSLADFKALLYKAIEAVSSKKLSVEHDFGENLEFQVGTYVSIIDREDDELTMFWVGFGWEENRKRESYLWLEFDAQTCPAKTWDKLKEAVGTSGKYYSRVDCEFVQRYMNAWIHFYLKEEYLQRFYDENADVNAQKEILTGFIGEALDVLNDKVSDEPSDYAPVQLQ